MVSPTSRQGVPTRRIIAHAKTDVTSKNKVTVISVKIKLNIDKASMKAFTQQFHDKNVNSEHNLCKKIRY